MAEPKPKQDQYTKNTGNPEVAPGIELIKGQVYGLRPPQYEGDYAVAYPYSQVQYNLPKGWHYIEALSEREYRILSVAPEITDNIDDVRGHAVRFDASDATRSKKNRRVAPWPADPDMDTLPPEGTTVDNLGKGKRQDNVKDVREVLGVS